MVPHLHSRCREFGDDGVAGMKAIRQQGWRTIVQAEASCVMYGMLKKAVCPSSLGRGILACRGRCA